MLPRCTGIRKQIGSIASNRTTWPGRVKRQFMVKVKGDQSVSITPVSGAIASLARLGEPPTHRSQPCGVRNRPWMWKVRTPWPNRETGRWWGSASCSMRMLTASTPRVPSHSASNVHGLSTSQPWALAMSSGRQR